MPSAVEEQIEAIVELLKPPAWYRRKPPSANEAQAWSARLTEAESRADAMLDGSPADCLALLMAILDADAAGNTIAPRLVPFIDENDLPILVEKLLSIRASLDRSEGFLNRIKRRLGAGGSPRLSDIKDILEDVAYQRPEIVPDREVEGRIVLAWAKRSDPSATFPTFHLIFEQGRPHHPGPIDRRHPTWHLPPQGPAYRMGGAGRGQCPTCGQPLIHLITLDQGLEAILGPLPALVLETCPNCWLWEPAYYQHDEHGFPTRITPMKLDEVLDMENVPLKEQQVRLAPTPKRWLRQNASGNLFRLGGVPSWIQRPQLPKAPQTDRDMQLLLQLDSLPDANGTFLEIGDSGLLYVFWDPETRVSCHLVQCY